MPDEPQWPTDDDDADLDEALVEPTVQVSRPSLDQPTMRFPVAAVLTPPSTPEPPRSSPVRSAPNGVGSGTAPAAVPLNGSGAVPGAAGGSSGGKSHGQVGPDGGQPRQVPESERTTVDLGQTEPPRAAPVRIAPVVEPKNDQTRVVPKPDQKTTELAVPPGKTARVDQLPDKVADKSWFDQPVRPEHAPRSQPQPQQLQQPTMRVDQLQRQEPKRAEQPQRPLPPEPRAEPTRPVEPPRKDPIRETLPVSGYDEEPEDRLLDDEPKKSRKTLAVVLGLFVVAALAGATIYAVNEFGGPAAVETKPPAAPAQVQPLVKAVTAGAPAPTPGGVKSALTGPAGNASLGTLTGSVVDPASGAALWQQGDTTAATPASSLKILTAAAALLSLDKTEQLSTKVVQGAEPGTVVIVGGGDPTISGTPGSSVYPGAATLDDLVNQVKQKGAV
ncbi:MAG TPA: D-alanyl-D-alanine carboxypeptidase, partial [Lentzea sp.]